MNAHTVKRIRTTSDICTMFVIIDVETTGGYARNNRITEVGAVKCDGKTIIDSYHTLVNPSRSIPHHIQELTGITNDLVASAPSFQEIAEELQEFLEGSIFVAHNVNFDYSFIKAEFERAGMPFSSKRMCSVRYMRKVRPGLRSYSLANLCKVFGIINSNPHRALSDAEATAQLLVAGIELDKDNHLEQQVKQNNREAILPANLNKDQLEGLPDAPGVYHFLNQKGEKLYIGKALNLKKRVISHFTGDQSGKRSQQFKREIHAIKHELTGSELVASLLEDHLIRHHWPTYNRAQKAPKRQLGVYSFEDRSGCIRLVSKVKRIGERPLKTFTSNYAARSWLQEVCEVYGLNPRCCELPGDDDVTIAAHNKGVQALVKDLESERKAYQVVLLAGRSPDEYSFAALKGGEYLGIGFVDKDAEITPKMIHKELMPCYASGTALGLLRAHKELNTSKWITIQT